MFRASLTRRILQLATLSRPGSRPKRYVTVFAEYFQRYDALILPVTPVPAHAHDAAEFVINGQSVSSLHVMHATAPFSVTGLPGMSLPFGTSRDGLPIGVQLVSPWLAESTILHLATLLESVSPVRNVRPDLSRI